ncbi:MAG: RIO1 family regulatory kinase/ATPase, partial [Polyangia bacterium]
IDAVHTRLMSGKEATVYVVERDGHLGAAKVYKARDDRTFKKTASYVEGRNQTRNTRDRRAMQNKSSYGRGLIEMGWQDMEFAALRAAFDAGVRVPEPYFLYENVLFMELIVDERGAPASRLVDFSFTPEVAAGLHQEIFVQVKTLLSTGRVHGDLSAYNLLMAGKGLTMIDLPQVVDVAGNNNALGILRRDLRNVTEHLARFDARLLRYVDCGAALFNHFVRGTLDAATGPEVGAPQFRGGGGGGGRRGRDAERGRAGREKNRAAGAGPPNRAGGQPNPPGGQPNLRGGQPNPPGGQPNPRGGQPNPRGGQAPRAASGAPARPSVGRPPLGPAGGAERRRGGRGRR